MLRAGRACLAAVAALIGLALASLCAPAGALAAEEHCPGVRGAAGALDWGINGVEQLGSGFGSNHENSPQPIGGLSGATHVDAGFKFGLALMGNCTLKAWGSNTKGQLGNGDEQTHEHPVAVHGLTEVKEIAVANAHAIALLYDGTVWTWAASEFGERGNGESNWEHIARQSEPSFQPRDKPYKVPGLSGVVQIAAGGERDYALLSSGEVEAWGEDKNGYLGVEESGGEVEECYGELHAITPVQCSTKPRLVHVTGLGALSGVERLGAGEEDAYAIRNGGSEVLAWGNGSKGQLGNGATSGSGSPVRASFDAPSPVREIAAGGQQVLARLADGEVYAWGADNVGQLGFEASGEASETCGRSKACSSVPESVLALEHVQQVAAGEALSLVLKEEESGARIVYSFGGGGSYELLGLDNPALVSTATPTPIEGLGPVSGISASTTTALALLGAGTRAPALGLSASEEALTATWSVKAEPYKLRDRPVGSREFSKTIEGTCKKAPCSATLKGLKPEPYEVTLKTPEGREGAEHTRKAFATPLPPPGWPVETSAPSISGSPATETGSLDYGQTLTPEAGTWTNGPNTFSYTWLRCSGLGEAGVAEEVGSECETAATGSSYVVAQQDIGRSLILLVEAKNGSGMSKAVSLPQIVLAEGEDSEPPYPTPISPPTISGVAVQGHKLTLHRGSWESSPVRYEDSWYRCRGRTHEGIGASCTPTPIATGESYVTTEEDDEKWLEVQETAINAGGYETVASQAVQIAPPAIPANTTPPTITGTVEQGQTLTVHEGTWTNAASNPQWQWQRCASGGGSCVAISGDTRSVYVIGPEDVGHSLEVSETTENGVGTSHPVDSAPTEAVPVPPGSPPEASAPPTITGSPQQGHTLNSHAAAWSEEPTSYSYQWKRCESPAVNCKAIPGASGSSYTLVQSDVGHTILLRETASNAAGTGVSQSTQTAVVEGEVPVASAPPSIRGIVQQGQVLSEFHATWSNEPSTYSYQWERCDSSGAHCETITGATSRMYSPSEEDVNGTLRVEEIASNDIGPGAGSTSAQSALVKPTVPLSIEPPSVSGVGAEGETLSAHEGTWSGSPSSRSDQWLRCELSDCTPIEGATGNTYRLTAADVGYSVEVREAARNQGGWAAASSEGIGVGGAPTPFITSLSPSSGPDEGATSVIITGGNLQEAEAVQFGFTAAKSFEILGPGRIRAVAPAGSTGSVYVTVTTPEGTSEVTADARYSYGPPPGVSGIEPAEGPSTGGTTVTIKGANLSEATEVKFGASDAQSFGVVSASTITAVAPTGSGKVGVSVVTPYGSTTPGAGEQYTYLRTGNPPAVTGLSVKKGAAAGGTTVVISGRNFTGATQVQFGSVAGPASFTVINSTTISATSPPGPPGLVDVQVTAEFGTSATSSKDHFKYEGPTVTGVAPASGPRLGGTMVTVSGTGFVPGEGGTTFKFGSGQAAFVECVSTTECTMIAPPGAHKGVVDVRAKSNKKNSKKVLADHYSYE